MQSSKRARTGVEDPPCFNVVSALLLRIGPHHELSPSEAFASSFASMSGDQYYSTFQPGFPRVLSTPFPSLRPLRLRGKSTRFEPLNMDCRAFMLDPSFFLRYCSIRKPLSVLASLDVLSEPKRALSEPKMVFQGSLRRLRSQNVS